MRFEHLLEAGVYTSASDSALSFSVFKWPEREHNQTHCFSVQGSAREKNFISTRGRKKKSVKDPFYKLLIPSFGRCRRSTATDHGTVSRCIARYHIATVLQG